MTTRRRMPRQGKPSPPPSSRARVGTQARSLRSTSAPHAAMLRPELRRVVDHAGGVASDWTPTVARVLLALVLTWFGYHELIRPGAWTGYVPVVPPASTLAVILVLAHGWILVVLAVALAAGIAPRSTAAIAATLLLEIVISLAALHGLSDLVLRDVGVLGLAVCLTGPTQQRLVLRG